MSLNPGDVIRLAQDGLCFVVFVNQSRAYVRKIMRGYWQDIQKRSANKHEEDLSPTLILDDELVFDGFSISPNSDVEVIPGRFWSMKPITRI